MISFNIGVTRDDTGITRPVPQALLHAVRLLTAVRLLWFVTVMGGLLRFYHYDRLSLWLDEGYTIMFARQPWASVLGLHGTYDAHPPLYYALVKLVTLAIPEISAGRVLSVVAGTLTIPVLFAIGNRLFGQWAALAASGALAVSPLHIWYSQEARQYAVAVSLVAMAYFALLSFYQAPGWRWAALYGISLLLGMYIDYSPLYAFVPQVLIIALIIRIHGRQALPLIGALMLAVVGYLPWVPQLIATFPLGDTQRASYLGVTPDRVLTSIRSILGFAENRNYFFTSQPTPWELWPVLHSALLAGTIAAFVLGFVLIWRHSLLAFISSLCLTIGTILVAALVSLISPGYAERTVLYATLGASLVFGALASYRLPGRLDLLRMLGIACVVLVFLLSLFTIFWRGDKQHWRDLAAGTASAATSGKLILTYPGEVADTLITVYEPAALSGKHINLSTADQLSLIGQSTDSNAGSTLWFAYLDIASIGDIRNRLADLGYTQVTHNEYWRRLYLDMYVRHTALSGTKLYTNDSFHCLSDC